MQFITWSNREWIAQNIDDIARKVGGMNAPMFGPNQFNFLRGGANNPTPFHQGSMWHWMARKHLEIKREGPKAEFEYRYYCLGRCYKAAAYFRAQGYRINDRDTEAT